MLASVASSKEERVAERTITPTDVEAVANKLDDLRDQLTDRKYETLQIVFRLAGSGLRLETQTPDASEVAGFMLTSGNGEPISEQLRLGRLHVQFSLGFGITPAAPTPLPLPYPNTT